ncbi:hypothetical protein H1D32_10250 [Anaerobacillus sp. CMMVII]|uniref:hypothetical protein n=1 Tax=Anaerobacillus sp. CMMVII TaxID=2755588 RepID=UPI0021B7164B|nr:hypothetical protein [Anaerobacillus sp. CMMVII]MCT8138101.1 hypothetical protein [Anaerobacillus sp. CMMVII]
MMRKPKTDKLLKGIVGTSLALVTVTGCGVNRHELTAIPDYRTGNPEISEAPALPSPEEADCDTWKWDEEAEGYQCFQESSQRYGHYYFGGMWFPTMAAFIAGRSSADGGQIQEQRIQPPPLAIKSRNQEQIQTTRNSE